MLLSFSGMLLNLKQGTNAPEYGGAQYTELEFSPAGQGTFKLRASGHVDLSAYLRREIDWSLEVEPKVVQGKTSFTVTKIAGCGKDSKTKS